MKNKMDTQSEQVIKKKLLDVIAKNLGSTTAEMYANFYNATDLSTDIISAREILSEVIGQDRANKEVDLALSS